MDAAGDLCCLVQTEPIDYFMTVAVNGDPVSTVQREPRVSGYAGVIGRLRST